MARGINKVILIGNLGNDPEVRYTSNNNAIATISVATTDSWRDKNTGEQQEKTEWHRVVMFNRLGEIAGEYLKKGSQIYIEGRLQTRKWQDKNGQDRYTTEIVANNMQILGSRSSSEMSSSSHQVHQETPKEGSKKAAQPISESSSTNDFDDDIPF